MDRQGVAIARGIVAGGLGIIVAVVVLLIAIQLQQLLLVFLLGIVVGVTLAPMTDYLQQRYSIPAVASVLVVYALIAAALVAFVWFATFQIAGEAEEFGDQIDELREQYENAAQGTPLPEIDSVRDILQGSAQGILGNLVSEAFNLFQAIFYIFTILFTGLLYTVTKGRMKNLFLSLVEPERRERSVAVLDIIGGRLRHFVLATLISMTVVGALTYAGLLIAGIRFPLLLAAIAFIFELLPTIGPWIAYVPALAIALTDGVIPAVKVSILYLAIQMIENYIVVPLAHGQQMPALLIIVAIVVGGALLGILGALAALPIAIIGYTLFFEVFVPWRRGQIGEEPQPVGAVQAGSEEQA